MVSSLVVIFAVVEVLVRRSWHSTSSRMSRW
jgi:hypothetical protein